jgi:hypothetical protein
MRPQPTAAELLEASLPYPLTYATILHLAQAYLDDPLQGDVTPALVYSWLKVATLTELELEQLDASIEAMRRAHFARLGRRPPRHLEPVR